VLHWHFLEVLTGEVNAGLLGESLVFVIYGTRTSEPKLLALYCQAKPSFSCSMRSSTTTWTVPSRSCTKDVWCVGKTLLFKNKGFEGERNKDATEVPSPTVTRPKVAYWKVASGPTRSLIFVWFIEDSTPPPLFLFLAGAIKRKSI